MVMKKAYLVDTYPAGGVYEEPGRSLFYRKALGLRRFYETCPVPVYHAEPLFPSGKVSTPSYMNGLAVDLERLEKEDKALADQIKQDFCCYQSSVPSEHTVAGDMYTHSMPNYERILKEGLLSYIPRIERIQDKDMREGLLHVLEGIRYYVQRCVSYLQSVQADEKLISALKKVPLSPAGNIYEAVVCWNFIMYLDSCDNLGCVASGLFPYYQGEDITALLENLFDNLNANDGYSMALGMDYNPLTLQCLEAVKGKRRPMIELFVDENIPDAVWDKAFASIRTFNGQPAFYNPHVLLKGLQRKCNVKDEDIRKFCGGGCTESMIAGASHVGSLDAGINLLLILERCIKTQLKKAACFEEFYDGYLKAVADTVDTVTREICQSQKQRAQYNPLPMRTLLVDDCIDNGLDFNNGGARYQWSIINFAGMINVIDALLVIRDFVFVNKTHSAGEFVRLLDENDKAFLACAKKHGACHGVDNTEVNAFSKQLSKDVFSMLENKKPYFGEAFLPASIQFMSQVGAGKNVGATPDGREAGAPLCDSLGSIFGKDVKGPTALLNSVASLELGKMLGVPILNFNINPDFKDAILKALILGYMKQGGIQMQITCLSRQLLEAAYQNPEDYKNLVVRVGGYSEYFYRLSDELKRMVIDRSIQNEV